ncbi:hypothetical protein ACQJBY_032683 [Aegilops geniculata]
MPALLSGVSASSKSGGDSYPSPFSLDPVFVRTASVHGLVFQKMDLTHDVGINLVNSLVSWAQDRSFLKAGIQFDLNPLSLGTPQYVHFLGEIVTFQPQALCTEEETEICAMRLHIQICTGHQGDMHILFVEGDNEHWLQVLPRNLSAPCCLREEGNVLPGCARSVIGDLNPKFIGAFSL